MQVPCGQPRGFDIIATGLTPEIVLEGLLIIFNSGFNINCWIFFMDKKNHSYLKVFTIWLSLTIKRVTNNQKL